MKAFKFLIVLAFLPTLAMGQGRSCINFLNTESAAAVNQLGLGIASELYESGSNFVYSPVSTSAAVQMAVVGATGSNRTEMMNVMGLTDEMLTVGFQSLIVGLTSDIPQLRDYEKVDGKWETVESPAYELTLTNAVWLNEDAASLNPAYAQDLLKFYGSPATAIPFNNEGVDTINDWVANNTKGKITNLISELDPADGRLVLTNAIRIKAKWEQPFAMTEPKPFNITSSQQITADTMVTEEVGIYVPMLEDEDVLAISLNTEGSQANGEARIQMHIIMPKTESVGDLLASQDGIKNIIAGLKSSYADSTYVEMPKFKIETKEALDLIPAFQSLGMNQAFVGQMGNFDYMLDGSPESLYIAFILQKAFIQVDENGFEAAAATAVGIGAESVPMPASKKATINQPFVYVITDNETGLNLFVGVVNNPAE